MISFSGKLTSWEVYQPADRKKSANLAAGPSPENKRAFFTCQDCAVPLASSHGAYLIPSARCEGAGNADIITQGERLAGFEATREPKGADVDVTKPTCSIKPLPASLSKAYSKTLS